MNKTVAHAEVIGGPFKVGTPEFREGHAPDIAAGRDTGRLRFCSYCGSMHPADVAAAIRAGAKGHWADFKYGWPHKAYFDGIPNPHAGMEEVRMWSSQPAEGLEERREPRYNESTGERVADRVGYIKKSIAGPLTSGKFYSEHLQDASPEDRETIEKHLGLAFTFEPGGRVSWKPTPKD
jgi:hypothetical protein